ncbi:hypothetical protein CEXT_471711 [Caerostris extrusa]|uniref:Cell growth-regulating nucleolar protein-like winged helix domain-containing protein n=1 Tax=Caerostris extrusa TaxID=172846 RepID=A0AAV4RTQ6_CAEEX|nr:hypothetical protein CEXT_471711 [Caerostris extrusa]
MDSSPSNIENQEKSIKFNWCAACEEILQNFPTGLREKTLRKKVIEKYRTFDGNSNTISDSKLKTIIREELSKNSNFFLYIDPSK